jgi:hypothetical protein
MSKHTRKSLVDVLGETRDKLARQFEQTEAAGDMVTLPRGVYRCRVTDGEPVTSKKSQTPGYQIVFTVDDGDHKGRKLWHTAWLTDAAMPMSKRDLAKLGVTSLDMLDRPLPACFVCDVKVALRADDDGVVRNRVVSFTVVDVLADPTADDDFGSPLPGDKEGGAA